MSNLNNDFFWFFLFLIAMLPFIGYNQRIFGWWNQKMTDRRRKRAHEGLVECEDEDCTDISTHLTPNGYFCDWHWEPMSKQNLKGGGYVIWDHVLNHTTRRP